MQRCVAAMNGSCPLSGQYVAQISGIAGYRCAITTINRSSFASPISITPIQGAQSMIRRLMLCLLLAASLPAVAAQKYDIDTNHTYVMFTYNHLGFSNPLVHLEKISADFQLDTADLTKSSIAVTLPLEGLHTGVAKLDDDLKSPNFFDAAKYPEITFKSTKVEKTGADGLKINGDLTVHGVTKPVVLNAKVNKIGDSPMGKGPSAGFEAEATLQRSAFGVGKLVPAVGDEIKVHISLDSHLAK
jgi:polyisoprenoid-binding protein YceI